MDTTDYEQKMHKLLEDEITYKKLNTTSQMQRNVKTTKSFTTGKTKIYTTDETAHKIIIHNAVALKIWTT